MFLIRKRAADAESGVCAVSLGLRQVYWGAPLNRPLHQVARVNERYLAFHNVLP